ncbi:MAG: DUF58 domain-containing protein [Candidatus Binatia bacterium]
MHEDYGIVASVAELVARRGDAARLDATPRGRVRTLHAGAYASAFRGRGMEFDETRQYQPGDDVRAIDWRVTARTGRVHTKLFHEERERPVLMLVDQRPHMRFGTRDAFKSVVAARAAATVAWAARDRGDRVGGLIVGDGPLRRGLHAPQRSRARLLHFLSALSDATASHERAGTGNELPPHPLADALALLARTSRPGTLLWIISDFADLEDEAARQLSRLARRCQVACVLVHDALEAALPSSDAYRVSDGTRVLELPTGSRRWREEYAARFAARREKLETLCRERGMGFVAIRTGDDVAALLRGGVRRAVPDAANARRVAAGGAR